MEYEKVEDKFSKWGKFFKKFIESDEFDKIFRELKGRNRPTAPISQDLFKAFQKCDSDNLKCIIVGVSPYSTFIDKKPVSNGIGLCCSYTGDKRLQPGLENFYDELERVYSNGFDIDMVREPDMSFLCEQGVLMYNVSLTTEENKPGSDVALWNEFDRYFWTEVINKYFRGIPCVFMGNGAHMSVGYLQPGLHYPLTVNDPGTGKEWCSDGMFKAVDKILLENNGAAIKWYKRISDEAAPWD